MRPLDVWDMTYRELFACFDARARQLRHEHRLAIITGYHAGIIGRGKKAPKLAELLRPFEEPRAPMSPKALRAAIIAANRAMGGKVIYKPKGSPKG